MVLAATQTTAPRTTINMPRDVRRSQVGMYGVEIATVASPSRRGPRTRSVGF